MLNYNREITAIKNGLCPDCGKKTFLALPITGEKICRKCDTYYEIIGEHACRCDGAMATYRDRFDVAKNYDLDA